MAKQLLENRSFDCVSPNERNRNRWSQTQLWFMINASFLPASTGALGSLAGLRLPWSIVVIISGSAFGTLFQAFHGAHGPRMGLPQVIQFPREAVVLCSVLRTVPRVADPRHNGRAMAG